MIRTAQAYRQALRDGREAWIDNERVDDVTTHPALKPIIDGHIRAVVENDVFHVSANTDPQGDRSRPPQDQDPDIMVHVVKETNFGITIRGAKCETAAANAYQAFLKPTIGARTKETSGTTRSAALSKWMPRRQASLRFDALDVLLPWEDVFFYGHTRAARHVLRFRYVFDMLIGPAIWNAEQTGLYKLPAVREKLADLVRYRQGIEAHLVATVTMAQRTPARLLVPHQSLL